MGLLDALNNLTQQMNKASDKIVNSNQQNVVPGSYGTQGLGIINTDNANGNLESPIAFNDKVDGDTRKLATDISKFCNNREYMEYIDDWLNKTGLFVTSMNNCFITAQMRAIINNQEFITVYDIYCCRDQNEADSVLKEIQLIRGQNQLVVIGYMNFSSSQEKTAKQMGIQLVDISGICEINNAIDLADRNIPYMTFSKTTFLHLLASSLHDKYKNIQRNELTQAAASIGNTLDSLGDRTSEALKDFSDGIGLGAGLGATENTTVNTQQVNNKVSLEKKDDAKDNAKVSLLKKDKEL